MRLLVIEDNKAIAETIRYCLKDHFAVDTSNNGKDGLHFARVTAYDTILLDLNLPDISGGEICRVLRKQGVLTPIIVVSGLSEVAEKVKLLTSGADDYMVKPFNIHELRARIDVALRRGSNQPHDKQGHLEIDGLILNPTQRSVSRYGRPISLRKKEFDLLEYLMRNNQLTLTRGMILEHIWDRSDHLWENVVTVHIKYLRDKVDRPYGTSLIQTVHGVGYKIAPSRAQQESYVQS